MMLSVLLMDKSIAKADIVIDMRDDCNYAGNHYNDCRECRRDYTIDDPNGEGVFYASPDDDTVVVTLENGEEVFIRVIYTDKNDLCFMSIQIPQIIIRVRKIGHL